MLSLGSCREVSDVFEENVGETTWAKMGKSFGRPALD